MSVCIVKLEMLVSHVLRLRLGGLGTTYDVGLGLIGKRVVDFLLMLIELFFARCYG